MLKQGQSFQKLGDLSSAKLLFKKLIDEFPETHQARIARQKLQSIPSQADGGK